MDQQVLDEALRKAVGRGSLSAAERWLTAGANAGAASPTGRTPLMSAVGRRERAPALIRLLLDHGAAVNAADRMHRTALHAAVQKAAPAAIEALLDGGANPDTPDRYGHPPLWYAIQHQSIPLVTLLLDRGADPNTRARGDWPLLFWAMRKDTGGGSPELVGAMLDRGADPNIGWNYDWTPLFAAVFEEHTDQVLLLLEYGTHVNPIIQGQRCGQPLCAAAMKQNPDLIRLLLKHGADPNLPDGRGQLVPLCHAALGRNPDCARLLLEAGADPLWAYRNGETLLEIAEGAGRADMAQLLREAIAEQKWE